MLAKLLRNKRFDKQMTQQEIAEILKISAASYRNKELGKNQFTLEEFKILIATLDITIDEIAQIFLLKEMQKCEIY